MLNQSIIITIFQSPSLIDQVRTFTMPTPSDPGPTTKRSLPVQQSSFYSDVSLLSFSSTTESNSWFCASCSSRNRNNHSACCTHCGQLNMSRTGAKNLRTATMNSNCLKKRSVSSPTVTLENNIILFSNPPVSSQDNLNQISSSETACSRTTRTSCSTKIVSNCASDLNQNCTVGGANTSKAPRRPSYEEEGEGCLQPTKVIHGNTSPRKQTGDEDGDEDEDATISSEGTERHSNGSPSWTSFASCHDEYSSDASSSMNTTTSSSSFNSPELRAKVPHDDPIEITSRRQSCPCPRAAPISWVQIPVKMVAAECCIQPYYPAASTPQLSGLNIVSESKTETPTSCCRSQNSFESFLPGLLRNCEGLSLLDTSQHPPTLLSQNIACSFHRVEEAKEPTACPLRAKFDQTFAQ